MGQRTHPVEQNDRVGSIDTLRGFALMGILIINVTGFGLPFIGMHNPVVGGDSWLDRVSWIFAEILVNGSMFATFSMLFGAGVVLLAGGQTAGGSGADIYYRRTILLIVFGLIHAYLLLMPGDILYAYGVVGLFLFPLRLVHPRVLLTAGLLIVVLRGGITLLEVSDTVDLHDRAALVEKLESPTPDQLETLESWNVIAAEHRATSGDLDVEIAVHRGGYSGLFQTFAPQTAYIQSTYLYETYFWEVLSMMLIGMGFHGLGVFSARRSAWFYARLMVGGYAVGVACRAWILAKYFADTSDPLFLIVLHDLYDLRLFIAIGHIGFVMLLCRLGLLTWLRMRLAAAGRMALTNYLLQTIVCIVLFNGFGFGLFGSLSRSELWFVILGIWLLQLGLSPVWLARFRFGPVEWVWRSLAYGRLQPMRSAR